MVREMGELAIARYDISDRVDMFHIRPAIAIRDDTSFIRDNLCVFQHQIAHIWYATEREKDMGIRDFLLLRISFDCRSEDELISVSVINTRMIADIDSGSLERRAKGMCEVIVLSSSEPISTYDHGHRRPLPSKCERHLDPDESSSYDDELFDRLLIEYRTVGQYSITRYSFDR